jgi:hypothetical protein
MSDMTTENKTIIGIAVIATIISAPIVIFYYAFALSYLWLWFLVPLGVPAIGMANALGIMLFKGFLWVKYTPNAQADTTPLSKMVRGLGYGYAVPTIALFMGYIYHSFM